MSKQTLLRPAGGLLVACGMTGALLFGASAAAQAGEPTTQCSGGCVQVAPGTPTTGDVTTQGNWEPH
ncbi:hypothetical protein [Streptomyces kanamyceticus]|uniref:Uncharacterized protein n=1 Tax=Streptomyces kanamyceticus TaxID=1967 RepID=A0A5J6GT10_STRKN|nr:hypothetical protein [Streptomyces kanamyceticus]QEU96146.1 hypothetical protein CP970_39115 [Streptomyces kanamyceticus]